MDTFRNEEAADAGNVDGQSAHTPSESGLGGTALTGDLFDAPPWDGPSKLLSHAEIARGLVLEARAAANQPKLMAVTRPLNRPDARLVPRQLVIGDPSPARRAQAQRTGPDWIEARALARRLVDDGQQISRADASSDHIWSTARASAAGLAAARHGGLLRKGVSRADAAAQLSKWHDAIRETFDDAPQGRGRR